MSAVRVQHNGVCLYFISAQAQHACHSQLTVPRAGTLTTPGLNVDPLPSIARTSCMNQPPNPNETLNHHNRCDPASTSPRQLLQHLAADVAVTPEMRHNLHLLQDRLAGLKGACLRGGSVRLGVPTFTSMVCSQMLPVACFLPNVLPHALCCAASTSLPPCPPPLPPYVLPPAHHHTSKDLGAIDSWPAFWRGKSWSDITTVANLLTKQNLAVEVSLKALFAMEKEGVLCRGLARECHHHHAA